MSLAGGDGLSRLCHGSAGIKASASFLLPSPCVMVQSLRAVKKPGVTHGVPISNLYSMRMNSLLECGAGWPHSRRYRPQPAVSCSPASTSGGVGVTSVSPLFVFTTSPIISFEPIPERPPSLLGSTSAATRKGAEFLRSQRAAFAAASGSSEFRRRGLNVLCRAGSNGEPRQYGPAIKSQCRYCSETISEKNYEGHHTKACRNIADNAREQERRVRESAADFKRLRAAAAERDGVSGGMGSSGTSSGLSDVDPDVGGGQVRGPRATHRRNVPATATPAVSRGLGDAGAQPSAGSAPDEAMTSKTRGVAVRARSSHGTKPLPRGPIATVAPNSRPSPTIGPGLNSARSFSATVHQEPGYETSGVPHSLSQPTGQRQAFEALELEAGRRGPSGDEREGVGVFVPQGAFRGSYLPSAGSAVTPRVRLGAGSSSGAGNGSSSVVPERLVNGPVSDLPASVALGATPPLHLQSSFLYPPRSPPGGSHGEALGLSGDSVQKPVDRGNGMAGSEHRDWLSKVLPPTGGEGATTWPGPGQISALPTSSLSRSAMPPASLPASGAPGGLAATQLQSLSPSANTGPPSTPSSSYPSNSPSVAPASSASTWSPPSSTLARPVAGTASTAQPPARLGLGPVGPLGPSGRKEPTGAPREQGGLLRSQDIAGVVGGNGNNNVLVPGAYGSLPIGVLRSGQPSSTTPGPGLGPAHAPPPAQSQVTELVGESQGSAAGSLPAALLPPPQQQQHQQHGLPARDRGPHWGASVSYPLSGVNPHRPAAAATALGGLGTGPAGAAAGIAGGLAAPMSSAPATSPSATSGPSRGPWMPAAHARGPRYGETLNPLSGGAGINTIGHGSGHGNGAGSRGPEETAALTASHVFLDDGRPAVGLAPGDAQASSAEKKLAAIIREGQQAAAKKQYRKPKLEPLRWEGFDETDPFFSSLLPAAREWLTHKRKVPEEVIRRNRIFCALVPVAGPPGQPPRPAVAFPFFRSDSPESVAFIKYRLFDPEAPEPFAKKEFRSSLHGEPIMYGINDIVAGGYTDIIVVEGEMDKLALNAAGFWNVVSVPNGAPAATAASPSSPPEQVFVRPGERHQLRSRVKQHYAFMDSFLAALPDLSRCRFTIATDNDPAGQALRRELLRRLGRERCWEVLSWDNEDQLDEELAREVTGPQAAAGQTAGAGQRLDGLSAPSGPSPATSSSARPRGYRKDANDVLMLDGPSQLAAVLEAAQPAKVSGLATFKEYEMEIAAYFQRQDPLQMGVSTGWPCLDPFYRVAPGELTIVTGVPNSGKSEWLDALMVNLAENHGWAFALCSMEKQPLPHLKALIEKRVRKPFRPITRMTPAGPQLVEAMALEEVVSGFNWLADHFHLIRYEEEDDTGAPTIDWVLQKARTAVMRFGIRGLLIDPYNELDSRRPRDTSETDFIREMLTKVRRFARSTECHVWFVAHPRQQKVLSGQAPGLYDISGSAHWFNKTDNGIVVHRRFEERTHPETGKRYRVALPEVDIKLQKVRNKDIGTQGEAYLLYDKATGRYEDPALLDGAMLGSGSGGTGALVGTPAGGQMGGADRVQQRNLELGYAFNSGSCSAPNQQQNHGADNIIDVTLGPSPLPSASPNQAYTVSAAAVPTQAFPPTLSTPAGGQVQQFVYPPSPPPGEGPANERHCMYDYPEPGSLTLQALQPFPGPPPPGNLTEEAFAIDESMGSVSTAAPAPQPRSGPAAGGPAAASRTSQRSPAGALAGAAPSACSPAGSSLAASAKSRACKSKVGQAGSKEAQGRLQRAASPSVGKALGGVNGIGMTGSENDVISELLRLEAMQDARQARFHDDGSTGGWSPDASLSEDDEAEETTGQGDGRAPAGKSGSRRRRNGTGLTTRSEAERQVLVDQGGGWLPKESERLNPLESLLAENEGVV